MTHQPAPEDVAREAARLLATRGPTPTWLLHAVLRAGPLPELTFDRLRRVLQNHCFTRFRQEVNGTWALRPEAADFDPGLRDAEPLPDLAHPPTLEPWPWQQSALDAWHEAGRRGVVEAVTGTGKTRVGLLAAFEQLRDGGRVHVVVPTIQLQSQWVRRFAESLPGLRVGRLGGGGRDSLADHDVLVSVINSAARSPAVGLGERKGLLIADECHRYGAETFSLALYDGFADRLGLTATYERNDDGCELYLDPYFGGLCFHYPYELAVPDEVVAPFAVAVIRVRFSEWEQREFDKWSEQATDNRLTLIASCGLPDDPFGEFMREASILADSEQYWESCVRAAQQYLKAFAEKRRILSECAAKYELLPQLRDAVAAASGTLIFTETIAGAELAARQFENVGIEAAPYHSDMNQTQRERLLRRFERGHLPVLSAPRVLDEGLDVPDADLAIILGATQTKRQMIQLVADTRGSSTRLRTSASSYESSNRVIAKRPSSSLDRL